MENQKLPSADIILYQGPKGNVHIEVLFDGDTFWLSQKRMAELFGVDVRTIRDCQEFSK